VSATGAMSIGACDSCGRVDVRARSMRIYEYATMTAEERRTMLGRSTADIVSRENLDGVRAIMEDVRRDGDAALVRALDRFDGVSITPEEIPIAPEEVEEARRTVPRQVQDAVATASTRCAATTSAC